MYVPSQAQFNPPRNETATEAWKPRKVPSPPQNVHLSDRKRAVAERDVEPRPRRVEDDVGAGRS